MPGYPSILCVTGSTYEELREGSGLHDSIEVYVGYDQNYRSDRCYESELRYLADYIFRMVNKVEATVLSYVMITKKESKTHGNMHMLKVSIGKDDALRMYTKDAFKIL